MSFEDELGCAAQAAAPFAEQDERLEAVLAAEPVSGHRVYLCAYGGRAGRTWLALDAVGETVTSRSLVREAVSLVALCEIAEEAAGIDVVHPRLATPAYLDEIGTPDVGASLQAIDALVHDVESAYKEELQ
jgi:hypothetical protein